MEKIVEKVLNYISRGIFFVVCVWLLFVTFVFATRWEGYGLSLKVGAMFVAMMYVCIGFQMWGKSPFLTPSLLFGISVACGFGSLLSVIVYLSPCLE